jgi:recombination protein RecA
MAKTTGPNAKALANFMADFGKRHEESNLQTYSANFKHEVVTTGSLAMDYALGVGGYVKGRIIELWGPEQTGKSTFLMITAGEFQRSHPDKLVCWIDVEATFDPEWARAHGMDTSPDRLVIAQPGSAEDVADIVKDMVCSDLFGFIVLDSIGAMLPQKEKEKDAGEATMGLVAKIITRMVKIAAAEGAQRGVILAMINQVRANLSYGGDTTTTGGFARGHVTTHRLKFRRASGDGAVMTIGTREKGDIVQVGQKIVITVEKNKVAPPKRIATLTFFNQATEKYGPIGIDKAMDVFKTAKLAGVLDQSGSWYNLPDGTKHNGEKEILAYLRSHPEAVPAIRDLVLATRAHEIITNPLEEG